MKCKEDANTNKEIICDSCKQTIHAIKCAGLTRGEISCLTAKDRRIKYLCDSCNVDLTALRKRVDTLTQKIQQLEEFNKSVATESLISEISERRKRASNINL